MKPRFTTVAERQDACPELQKNFNGQQLSYVRNNAGAAGGRVPTIGPSAQLPQNPGVKARSNKLAGQLLRPDASSANVIVDEVV